MESIINNFNHFVGKRNLPLIVIISVFLLCLIMFNILFSKNDLQHFVIVEKVPSGTLVVKKDPGHFFKGIHRTYRWNWARPIWFSSESREGKRRDESVPVRYLDGALANISGIMVYQFNYDTPDRTLISHHQSYNNQQNFEDRVIKPMNLDALRIPASLMTSEDSYTIRKKEFGEMAIDQLLRGILRTYTEYDTIVDFTGEQVLAPVTKIMQDDEGNYLRSREKSLGSLNINVPLYSLYEPVYQDIVDATISRKRQQEMGRIISYASTQLEQRKERMERINGELNIINQRYDQEVENMVAVTQAQTRQDTMRIRAETRVSVSEVREGIAQTRKEIELLEGNAELQIRRLSVQADNQLLDRLNAYVFSQQKMAEAYARGKQIMPEFKLSSGSSVNGAWDMFLYNQARPLQKKE